MKTKVLTLAFLTALTVTGCVRFDETISYNGDDEITVNTKSYIETSVYDDTVASGGTLSVTGDDFVPEGKEVVDDTEYYFQNKSDIATVKKFTDDWCYTVYTRDSFYGDLSKGFLNSAVNEDIKDMDGVFAETVKMYLDGYKLIVNFDNEVIETNGKADGNSVVFEYDPKQTDATEAWYAYTGNTTHTIEGDAKIIEDRVAAMEFVRDNEDTVKPVIKLVKSKINLKKVYVLVKDNQKLKKVVINGKKYTSLKKRKLTSGNYKGYYRFSSTKKGKNSVKAYDAAGNVRKGSFTIK